MKDIERDPHLSAALRHAPDAGLAAPADISAQILAAAHRAAAERPAAARSKIAMPWRLGASGAFASVALAGVIGLLWRGEPAPGPAVERMAEAAPAAPVVVAAVPAAGGAPPAVVVAAAPSAPSAPSASSAPSAPAPAARRAMVPERRLAAAPAPTVVNEAAPLPMSAPVPAPAPLPSLAQAADSTAAATEATAARPARGEMLRSQGAQRAAAPAAVMAVPRPDGPWMDALAEGKAVQWRVDGEARAPTSSWLYALAAQTEGRWRPASGMPAAAGDNMVQWWRGDLPLGRLWLGAQRVLWCDAQGRCEEAALEAEVASALRKGLAR